MLESVQPAAAALLVIHKPGATTALVNCATCMLTVVVLSVLTTKMMYVFVASSVNDGARRK